MATGKLTDTVFIAGPDDKLGVLDVYEQSSPGVVNSYQENFHDVPSALDDFLSDGLNAAAGVMDFVSSNLNSISDAIESAYGMVNGVIGGVMGAVNGVMGVVSGVVGTISGAIGAVTGAVSNVVGGVVRAVGSAIGNVASVLGGFLELPIKVISGIVGAGSTLAANFVNTVGRIEKALNVKIDFNSVLAIGKLSDRLSGSLNTVRNGFTNKKPLSIAELLTRAIVNYGAMDPRSNSLSGSINRDLDRLLGGDRASAVALTRPALNRASTLNHSSAFDQRHSTLSLDTLLSTIDNADLHVAIKDLTPAAQAVLVRGLKQEQVFTGNKIAVNGAASVISPQVSVQNKKAIESIISAVTGDVYPVHTRAEGSQVGVMSGVVHLASKAGFPKPFTTITKNQSPTAMVEIAKPLLKRAIEEGDFEMIEDVCSTPVSKSAARIVPQLIQETKVNLKKPQNLSQQEYSNYYMQVKNVFEKVNPNWSKYESGKIKAVDATGICENPFLADLIEAQLNTMKAPEANLSNTQLAYPKSQIDNPTELLNSIGLPESTFVTDEDGQEVEVKPIPWKKPELLKLEQSSFKDEPFLLLGRVFLNSTVDSEIKKHFPYFYETLEHTPIPALI